jgi:hypothetical protein
MSKNELNFNQCSSSIIFMKVRDNITPVPEVLTQHETIQFLRLDEDGPANPEQTLRYYREKGYLKAVRIGKRLRYTKQELLKFLDILAERGDANAS